MIFRWIGYDLEEGELGEEGDRKKADDEQSDNEDPEHRWAAFPNWIPVRGEDEDEKAAVRDQPTHLLMSR